MKKKTIVLSLVPFFALMACSNSNEPNRIAVPSDSSKVALNNDGSYSQKTNIVQPHTQDADQDLKDSFDDAVRNGYKGTKEDWAKLSALYEADPEKATEEAKNNGFSSSDLVLATLAGVAISSLAVKAMSNHSDGMTNAYQQQRLNNQANYAHSQPYKPKEKIEEEKKSNIGGGAVGRGAVSSTPTSQYSAFNNSSTARMSGSSSGRSGYTSVSRGGFGGAVGRGG